MPGKNLRLSPLESRKQLLIAESEINRVQMLGDVVAVSAGVRTFADRAGTLGTITMSTATLVAGLSALRRGQPAAAGVKPSWLQSLLKGAGVVSTLWSAFRPPGRD
jgi:hypothetical protein